MDATKHFDEAKALIWKIARSDLRPDQSIDALASFMVPSVHYQIKVAHFSYSDYDNLDVELLAALKELCFLYDTAPTNFIRSPVAHAGLGFHSFSDLKAAFVPSQAVKFLNPSDSAIGDIARISFMRSLNATTPEEAVQTLISPAPHIWKDQSKSKFETKCFWSYVNLAIRHLRSSIQLLLEVRNGVIIVSASTEGIYPQPLPPDEIFSCLLSSFATTYTTRLIKSAHCHSFALLGMDPISNYFLRSGEHLSREDWEFIHKARLDLQPCNAKQYRKQGHIQSKCRLCPFKVETLGHILGGCFTTNEKTNRHNEIVKKVAAAVLWGQRISANERNSALDKFDGYSQLIEFSGNRTLSIDRAPPLI